jgi:hypothetical protein
MDVTTSTGVTAAYMVVLGAGMGCLMQTTNLIAQNSVALRDIGSATGSTTFTRTMGGSLGVAILGAIYTHELTTTLSGAPGAHGAATDSSGLTPAAVKALPAPVRELFQLAVANGTAAIFFWAAIVGVAGFAASWFIRELPLRDTVHGPAEMVEETEALAM